MLSAGKFTVWWIRWTRNVFGDQKGIMIISDGKKAWLDFLNNLQLMFNNTDLHCVSWNPILTWDATNNTAAIP